MGAFSESDFRSLVERVCTSGEEHLVVSYSRSTLSQTGDGHFSPIGGYHRGRDEVLILDVARFKVRRQRVWPKTGVRMMPCNRSQSEVLSSWTWSTSKRKEETGEQPQAGAGVGLDSRLCDLQQVSCLRFRQPWPSEVWMGHT